MPCQRSFDPVGATRGGARAYCELESGSFRTRQGMALPHKHSKLRFRENYMTLRTSACATVTPDRLGKYRVRAAIPDIRHLPDRLPATRKSGTAGPPSAAAHPTDELRGRW